MAGFGSTSMFIKIAFVLILVATLFHLIGFATTSWMTDGDSNFGLWQFCQSIAFLGSVCSPIPVLAGVPTAHSFRAVRAMETICLLVLFAACILTPLYIFLESLNTKMVAMIISVLCFVAVGTSLLGVIIFGADLILITYEASWSMALCIVAEFAALAGGILFIVGLKK